MSTVAEVKLWGRTIGAVSLDGPDAYAAFQYDPEFARSGIEVSPLTMPLGERVYTFPELPRKTFHGLPGLLLPAKIAVDYDNFKYFEQYASSPNGYLGIFSMGRNISIKLIKNF